MKQYIRMFACLLWLGTLGLGLAQTRTVTGQVLDENGSPLPGATIIELDTSNGVTTDFDGNFSITIDEGAVLEISFVGYETQTLAIGTDTNYTLQMVSRNELEEVVVTAYGSQKRESISGSISVINADQIESATFSNAAKSLEGLVSGLRIIQSNGQPGSDPQILIRGYGSINADNQPLIVLDGVPYSGKLSSINPQDIESTTVLKDASSTSLYGNKASNGVLMITTKKGTKNRKPQITIDSRYGITQRGSKEYNIIQTPQKFYETYHSVLANSEFYRTNNTEGETPLTFEAARQFASDNLIDRLGYNIFDVPGNELVNSATGVFNPNAKLLVNDRWADALLRDNAEFNATNLNISGGSKNIDYYFSLGTEENNGYTLRSNFKRHTARVKVNATKIADILSFGGDISYANSSSQGVPSTLDVNGNPASFFSNSFFWLRRIAPIYPVYKYDKDWKPVPDANNPSGVAYDFGAPQVFDDGSRRGPRNYAVGEHPLAVVNNTDVINETDNFNSAFRAKIELPYGFQFEYVLNYLIQSEKGTNFRKPGAGAFAASNNGLLTNNRDQFTALTHQQLLTWKNENEVHSYDFLLGYETYVERFTTLSLSKRNIIGTFSPILSNTSVYASGVNYNTKYATEGYFSRFIYGLDNTYFVNLTGRYDASSVFHPDERWGLFWSAGASWIMSNEAFLKDSKTIDYAKFAINYGTTGNDRIFYSETNQRNLVAYENQYEIGENNGALTQTLYSLGNKNITWEKASSLDIAYEMSVWDRVNLSLGYYHKKTQDLLFNNPIQLSTGQTSKPENFGSMVNSGVELEVNWDAVKKEKFNVSVNTNISSLKNEITELPRDSIPVGNFRRVVGKSIYDYYMVEFAGVNPENGNAQYYTIDPDTKQRVKTENHDEAVTYGRKFIGKRAIPDFVGGFGTQIRYDNFSLGLQFAYQIGGYGIDSEYYSLLSATQNVTNIVDYDKTWTVNTPDARLPRVDPLRPDQYRMSDLQLVDLSYLSLSNINLSYLLQNDYLRKSHIESIKIYGVVNNAFLLYSARQGYDPRLSATGRSAAEYGANRTMAVGVNIYLK